MRESDWTRATASSRSGRRPPATTCRDDPSYVVTELHTRFVCNGEKREFEQTIIPHRPWRSAFDCGTASSLLAGDGGRTASAIRSQIRIFLCRLRRLATHDVPPLQGRATWAQQDVRRNVRPCDA